MRSNLVRWVWLGLIVVWTLTSACHGGGGGGGGGSVDNPPVPNATIVASNGSYGRVLTPGQRTRLGVSVAGPDGAPLGGQTVVFVAPDSGATGAFDAPDPLGPNYFRAHTDGSGVASAVFVPNTTLGPYLIDAFLEGTDVTMTFAVTTLDSIPAAAASIDDVRAAVGALAKTPDSLLNGPVLLPAGATVTSTERMASAIPVSGLTWFFWWDDARHDFFDHPTRFVTLDATTPSPASGTPAVHDQQGWPLIQMASGGTPSSLRSPLFTNAAFFSSGSDTTPPPSLSTQSLGVRPLGGGGPGQACSIVLWGGPDAVLYNNARQMTVSLGSISTILLGTSGYLDATGGGTPNPFGPPDSRHPGRHPSIGDFQTALGLVQTIPCSHLYVYIAAHGDDTGLDLENAHDASGNTITSGFIDYVPQGNPFLLGPALLAATGGTIPVSVILQSCKSGAAIPQLQALALDCKPPGMGMGLTGDVVTAADASHTATSYAAIAFLGALSPFTYALLESWSQRHMGPLDAYANGVSQSLSPLLMADHPIGVGLNLHPLTFAVPDVTVHLPGQGTVTLSRPNASDIESGRRQATVTVADASIATPDPTAVWPDGASTVGENIHAVAVGATKYTVCTLGDLYAYEGMGTITVDACPGPSTVTGVSVTSGPALTPVTITGTNLGHVTTVRFSGVLAPLSSQSATQILTSVPSRAATGPLTLNGGCGLVTAVPTFTIPTGTSYTEYSVSEAQSNVQMSCSCSSPPAGPCISVQAVNTTTLAFFGSNGVFWDGYPGPSTQPPSGMGGSNGAFTVNEIYQDVNTHKSYQGTIGGDGALGPTVVTYTAMANSSLLDPNCQSGTGSHTITWTPEFAYWNATVSIAYPKPCPMNDGSVTNYTAGMIKNPNFGLPNANINGLSIDANVGPGYGMGSFTAVLTSGGKYHATSTGSFVVSGAAASVPDTLDATFASDGTATGTMVSTYGDGCVETSSFTMTPLSPLVLGLP